MSLRANRDAFESYRFLPSSLVDVSRLDTSVSLFGTRYATPFGLAPTGYTRMFHPDGENGVASAAVQADIPYCLSTVASTSLEEVAVGSGRAPWQQLYVLRDSGVTRDMVERARRAGCPVLVVAADVAVSGNRLRDLRNGLTIPPRLGMKQLAQIALRPGYWFDLLSHRWLDFENIQPSTVTGAGLEGGSTLEIGKQFDPGLDWRKLSTIRESWDGPLVLKGVMSVADARRAVAAGVDGIWLSNHGGRQLDRTAAPIDLVAEFRAAVPGTTLIVDSGVRSGADVALAIALGADAAFLGRPYLWALTAEGAAGVRRLIEILADELARTLALLGVTSISALRERGTALVRRAR